MSCRSSGTCSGRGDEMILRTRGQVVKWAIFGVDDQRQHLDWHWLEERPFHLTKGGPHILDCSAFCVWTYWMAGARDPSGNNFDGYGNSVTLWERGRHITKRQLKVRGHHHLRTFGRCARGYRGDDRPRPVVCEHRQARRPFAGTTLNSGRLGEPTFLRFRTLNRRLIPSRKQR